MKILCAPLDLGFKIGTRADLEVVLYGHPDTQARGGAGANIREALRRLELKPAARAWDILSIALAVTAADTAARRNESPDGWTRDIELQLTVGDPAFWSSQIPLVTAILRFLTTDIWKLSFLDKGVVPVPPKRAKMPEEDCVSLLSGGLDSLIGALDLTARHSKRPYLVSQVAVGDKEKQIYFASKIAGGLSHLQLNHVVTCPGENERSQRARSLIFLAYGVLLATTLRRYHEGKPVTLYVCENGFISVNPPLTPGRLGSLRIALGLHPQLAHERHTELSLFEELLGETRYVGEIGLDGAPEFRGQWDVQVKVFTHILEACRRAGGRIMSIHSRRASKAVLGHLAAHKGAGTPILHWFSGTLREVGQAADLGCWFSVGPAMLRTDKGREIAALIPRDRILTETDGPFAQIDGKSLAPWQARHAVELLGTLWNVQADAVETTLRDNLRRLVTQT